MSEVQVTVGANITPFKAAMEQVKATAAQAGKSVKETLGVESGSSSAFREESRATKGIERFTAALANAKDPLSGFAQGLEGLAQGFRLTGALFAGFAIGDFLREQLTKAADSASDFYDKTSQIFEVGKDSSREFANEAVKNFEEAQKAYGEEGFLAKLIYGAGQRKTIDAGKDAAEAAKKTLAELNAQIIRDQTATINGNPLDKMNAESDLKRDEYKKQIDEAKSPEEKVALEEKLQAELGAIRDKFVAEDEARLQKQTDDQERANEKQKSEYAQLADEKAKQAKLADEAGGEKTGAQKIAEAQKELDAATEKVKTTWGTSLEQAKLVTAQMEAQNKLADAITADAEKRKAINDDIALKTKDQSKATNDVNSALNEAEIFHGETSSLRKIGLGGGVSQNNTEQVKKLTEANQRLDKIHDELQNLNEKLQST